MSESARPALPIHRRSALIGAASLFAPPALVGWLHIWMANAAVKGLASATSDKDKAFYSGKIEGAKFFKTFEEIERDLRKTAQPGDLILTVGAGNVYKIGEHLLADDYET